MKLSICMIVKNEAEMLPRTLPSLNNAADEIILVDTGSSDDTIKIAEKYGAKVYQFAWADDFASARNFSLKFAGGDWIIWLDADEYINAEDLKALKSILENTADNAFSFTMCEADMGEFNQHVSYERVKVFRNGLNYRFIRPINEQLVDQNGGEVRGGLLPVSIYHWGKHLDKTRMRQKREKYVELYSEALKKNPEDPNYYFLLGNNLSELGREEEALESYKQVYRILPDGNLGKQALEKISSLLFRMKRIDESINAAEKLIKIDPNNLAARNIFASFYLVTGKIDLAIDILKENLQIKIDGDIYESEVMPNFLLSKAYALKGETEKAKKCLDQVIKINPKIAGVN